MPFKHAFFYIFMCCSVHGVSQVQLGLDITPSFQFQLLRNQQTLVRSSVSGSGFSTGLIAKAKIKDFTHIQTGVKLEYVAYNQKSGNFLISSYRILGLSVPVLWVQNIGVTENWLYSAGGGVNFNFSNRNLFLGNWVSINQVVNRVQPYLALGLNYLPESMPHFEIGALARYHLVDNYTAAQQDLSKVSTHLAAFDLSIKYFFNSGNEN